jgi:hypothetical protein
MSTKLVELPKPFEPFEHLNNKHLSLLHNYEVHQRN